jgi:hypothetical protein
LKNFIATARKQSFRKLNTDRLRVLDGSYNGIANEFFAVHTGYQSFQHHLSPGQRRMRRDRNLTASLKPMEQRTFSENGSLGRSMVQFSQQCMNNVIVSASLNA